MTAHTSRFLSAADWQEWASLPRAQTQSKRRMGQTAPSASLDFPRWCIETANHFSAILEQSGENKATLGPREGQGVRRDAPEQTASFKMKGLVFLECIHITSCLACRRLLLTHLVQTCSGFSSFFPRFLQEVTLRVCAVKDCQLLPHQIHDLAVSGPHESNFYQK